MEWSNDLRNRCFGSNRDFINNYCSPRTIKELGAVSGDRVNEFRKLARLLTEIFPKAAHYTPGWRRNPNPVISLGNLSIPSKRRSNQNANKNLKITIKSPRTGLCLVGNDEARLALWADASFLGVNSNSDAVDEIRMFEAEWSIWRRRNGNNRSLDKFICASDASHFLDNNDAFTRIVGIALSEGNTDQTIIDRQHDGGDERIVETLFPLIIHMRNRASKWFQPT